MTTDTARLFIGLELSDEARRALSGVRCALEESGVAGKFHRPELYHLTLCLLGNTLTDSIPHLQRILDSVSAAPFTLTLSSLGSFKNGSILWAGVRESAELRSYQSRLAAALTGAGFPLEEGEYHPHITLARQVKTPFPDLPVPEIPFRAAHATLFHSTRVDGVLTYLPIYRSVFP